MTHPEKCNGECIHEEDLKDQNKYIQLILRELGIKDYKNGDRDKRIAKLTERLEELGERTEDEDKTLSEKVNQILIMMESKASKTELPSKFLIYVNTLILAMFVLAVIIDNAKDIFCRLLGL